MAERSYPFDSGPGATINEDQWSYMAGAWQEDGVDALGPWDTSLKLTSASEALILHIDAGHANVSGIHYDLDAPKTLTFASNATANSRIDRVVLKLDRSTNTVSFLYKQGTPATSPIAPTVDRTWASPEINIGTFIVRAGSSTVLPAECFDERDFLGRYVKVSEDTTNAPEGSIVYKPSVKKFFAKGATPIELGAPPDLTPYSLTTHNHNAAYATLNHTHSTISVSSTTNFSYSNGFSYVAGEIQKVGTLCTVNLVVTSANNMGRSVTVTSGFRNDMLTINDTSFRPTGTHYMSMQGWNDTSGVAVETFDTVTGYCQTQGSTMSITPTYSSNSNSFAPRYYYFITGSYRTN